MAAESRCGIRAPAEAARPLSALAPGRRLGTRMTSTPAAPRRDKSRNSELGNRLRTTGTDLVQLQSDHWYPTPTGSDSSRQDSGRLPTAHRPCRLLRPSDVSFHSACTIAQDAIRTHVRSRGSCPCSRARRPADLRRASPRAGYRLHGLHPRAPRTRPALDPTGSATALPGPRTASRPGPQQALRPRGPRPDLGK